MTRRRVPEIALTAAALLLLGGCGDRPGYDASAVESYLSHSQADAFPGAEVGRAACPDGLRLRENMGFTCTLDVSGAELPFQVRLTHVHAARMAVSATTDGVIMSATRLRDVIRKQLPKGAEEATLDCGGDFVAAAVGGDLACTMTLGSQQKELKVTVKDASGRVSVG